MIYHFYKSINSSNVEYFQEPGTSEQICNFAKKKNVQFDIFEKIEVNGENAHPLYKYLKKQQPGTLGK